MWKWSLAAMPLFLSVLAVSSANAAVIYDPGTLNFVSNDQSMWGSGSSFTKSDSIFLGSQWSNKTATIGGIAGDAHTQITPAVDPQYVTVYVPRITVPDPTWSNPFRTKKVGCGCNVQVQVTPSIPATYLDTRTGAKLDLTTSGKVGLDFGYTIDSGSVDTAAAFGATAQLPDTVQSGQYFSIGTDSNFSNGKIHTQSPQVDAYMSAVLQLSGNFNAQACGFTLGCASSGNVPIPTVNLNQKILSIDPNSLKILDGIGPGGQPFAEVPLLNQGLTLEGGVAYAPPAEPVVGFKLTGPYGITLASSLPPTPSLTVDLAEVTANVPNIATDGTGGGTSVSSNGRDDLLTANLDVDGAATLFGGLPPAGVNFDLIDAGGFKLGASLDLIDVKAGPVLGVTQNFNFSPTLMTTIDFSNPVMIEGMSGLQNSWTGLWGNLPNFAITQDTTFTPHFWLDSTLQSILGLDLGLQGTLDVLKLGATASVAGVDLLQLDPLSLNQVLGISNKLFSTDKLNFSILDKSFALGGFNSIIGPSFTLSVSGQAPVITGFAIGNAQFPVPEPGSLWLFAPGLLLLLPQVRRLRRRVLA